MLYSEMNHVTDVNELCGQNAKLFMINARVEYPSALEV